MQSHRQFAVFKLLGALAGSGSERGMPGHGEHSTNRQLAGQHRETSQVLVYTPCPGLAAEISSL